jgi:hypothetical protein
MDPALNRAYVVIVRRYERAKVTNITAIHWSPSREPKPESCQVTTLFVPGQSKGPARAVPGEEKETR